jgi:Flavodoxin
MKTIIVYYSLDGNTKSAAEVLAEMIGADGCEIQPVKPIRSAGKPTFRVLMQGGGQVTFGICPKLKAFSADLASYDRIILGTPVWAGRCASPVYGFIKKYCKKHALSDKIQAAFTLSGSGDNSGCVRQLQKLLPNIGATVSLADKSNSLSADNEKKLRELAEQLQQ